MRCHLLLFASASALASSAVADTKVSGSFECDKPEPRYVIPVPDQPGQPGRVFLLEQRKCRWTKPWTIAGSATTENTNIAFVDVTGDEANIITVSVTTYASGDKTFVHSLDKSGTAGSSGKWKYTSGTGKLQGIRGQGTSKCKPKSADPEAGITCDVAGSYKLAAPKKN